MATVTPNAKLVTVPEGWHEWALWYPDQFTMILLDFMQAVGSRDAIAVEHSG